MLSIVRKVNNPGFIDIVIGCALSCRLISDLLLLHNIDKHPTVWLKESIL